MDMETVKETTRKKETETASKEQKVRTKKRNRNIKGMISTETALVFQNSIFYLYLFVFPLFVTCFQTNDSDIF